MNNTNDSSDSDTSNTALKICTWYSLVTIGILHSVLYILCLVGNTLSFYAWNKIGHKKGYNSSVILMLCLIIANVVFEAPRLVVLILSTIAWETGYLQTYLNNYYPYCSKYLYPVMSIGNFATVWLTTLITVHRYAILGHPFSTITRHLVSVKSTLVQTAVIALIATAYNVPRFFEVNIVAENSSGEIKYEEVLTNLYLSQPYQVYYMTVSYLILANCGPLLLCTLLTIKILHILAKAQNTRKTMTSQTNDRNREAMITTTLLAVVIIFIICQTPTMAYRIVLAIIVDVDYSCGKPMYYVPEICSLFLSVNASVNVFVYVRCNQEFQNTLKAMCCCCCKRKRDANAQLHDEDATSNV